MASRVRDDKVPKLKISYQQLQKKCSELLLDGFESKPTEDVLQDEYPSSSCNDNEEVTNLSNDAGQSQADSPKTANVGGLFHLKHTSYVPGASLATEGSRSEARRRRGSEQPERTQRDRRLIREDDTGRFSEPTDSRSSRTSGHVGTYGIIRAQIGRSVESTNGRRQGERTRLRRHTDEGRSSDQRFYTSREEKQHSGMFACSGQ